MLTRFTFFKPYIEPVKAVQKAMEFWIFFVINSLFLPFWLNVIYPTPLCLWLSAYPPLI